MKKAAFVLSLVCALVMGMAGSAYAAKADSGYLAAGGVSPHGGYTTSSKKCAVCHAVHHASNTGQVLMEGTVANACVYCHITNTTGIVQIYNGVEANYNGGDVKNAHNSTDAPCTGCHTPHAASSLISDNAFLKTKILQGKVASISSGDASETAVSKWCTNCHQYYETSYDTGVQTSHVMTTAKDTYGFGATVAGTKTGLKVAWSSSDTCRACHNDGKTGVAETCGGVATKVASSFPHYTTGQRFLTAAGNDTNSVAAVSATDSSADGVCIRCHVSAGSGVGNTF